VLRLQLRQQVLQQVRLQGAHKAAAAAVWPTDSSNSGGAKATADSAGKPLRSKAGAVTTTVLQNCRRTHMKELLNTGAS
jgi:hypothetical protein